MITRQNKTIRNLVIGLVVVVVLAVIGISAVLSSRNAAPVAGSSMSPADAQKIVCEANGIFDTAQCDKYIQKVAASMAVQPLPTAMPSGNPPAQRSAVAVPVTSNTDPLYVPVSIQAHGTLFDNWKDPNKVPTVAPSATERFLVISSDPCVYTLQDENNVTVWEYDTGSSKGSLAFLRIPAKYTLYVTMYNWQPNATHWPISGAAYSTLVDATQAWQLIHYGEFAEIKPTYIDNVGSDLRNANISANKPVRTIP